MAKQDDNTIHALAFFTNPASAEPKPVCVVAGDDGFLRHETRKLLVAQIAGAAGDDVDVETFDGRQVELRDVLDGLSELSLFGGGGRIVVVEEADALVKSRREQLEDYVATPRGQSTLVLDVQSWPGNTRLAKAVAKSGLTIRCNAPQQGREVAEFDRRLKKWLAHAAKQEYDVNLAPAAADALLELLPSEPGILYQEIAKLSLLAGGSEIDASLVREHVGGWRTQKTWDMIDAAADGRAAEALSQLDRLFAAGEEPHALLPQMAATLRKFSAATLAIEQAERDGRRQALRPALEAAGVPRFKLGDAERQLRQIGRQRARMIYDWLLAADLELKGHNSTKDRARRVLETLIVRLSKDAPASAATR